MLHTFNVNNMYLVLDVESGALHSVDKMAYDIIKADNEGKSPYDLPYEKSDIDEVLKEINELKEMGALDTPMPDMPDISESDGIIKAMCLHIAHDCNLRCKYCFAETGEYRGGRMLMSEEVGKASLDFLVKHSGNRHNLEVDLFGGEPLVNFDVVKAIVDYGRELEKKHNKNINFTITTNGVALDDEKIDYINREMYNVVISIDGRREVHDMLRKTPNGKGSFDIIVPNAKKLIERRGDKEYYIRGTFTSKNLDFVNDVKELEGLGFERISIEPVVLPDEDELALRTEHLERIFAEYESLTNYLSEKRRNGKHIVFFHFMLDMGHGPCLKKRIKGCGAGVEYVAVTPQGDIYPCHQFVGETDYRMGSVVTGELNRDIQNNFARCNILTKEVCKECWAKYFCSGGCAANAYKYNGSIYKPHKVTCELLKKRTECGAALYAESRTEE